MTVPGAHIRGPGNVKLQLNFAAFQLLRQQITQVYFFIRKLARYPAVDI